MKLMIQVPCLNEEETLPVTLAAVRATDFAAELPGVTVEVTVIDDGSTDRTAEVARSLGADHIIRHGCNRGLAAAFRSGLDYALKHDADVIVNLDADNQYCAADIPKLVRPVLEGVADIVVGCRPIREHKEFSPLKKTLQIFGSWTLRCISKTSVRDAASGFRAFSREAALRLFIHTRFSYCMETLIQAGNSGLRVDAVDIRVNPTLRPSRLFRSIPQYIRKSGGTMLMMFALYRPGRFFMMASLPFWLLALGIGVRAVLLRWLGDSLFREHLPSLILLVVGAVIAIMLDALAVIGELLKAQRRLTEEVLYLERGQIYRRSDRQP